MVKRFLEERGLEVIGQVLDVFFKIALTGIMILSFSKVFELVANLIVLH